MFEVVNDLIIQAREIGAFSAIQSFIQRELLMIDFLLLAVGFVILLVEVRLPLKYYWNLPSYSFKRFLQNFHILPSPPMWGTVRDDETNVRIPLAAVELVEQKSLRVIDSTFTNRRGEYGFVVPPGEYYVRAVKNYYSMPSFLDPENIELVATDESFAVPVTVQEETIPNVHMRLIRLQTVPVDSWQFVLRHYLKTFLIAFSNGCLLLSIIISYVAWVVGTSPLYGLLIVVGIVLLFIKIYILETVGIMQKEHVKRLQSTADM